MQKGVKPEIVISGTASAHSLRYRPKSAPAAAALDRARNELATITPALRHSVIRPSPYSLRQGTGGLFTCPINRLKASSGPSDQSLVRQRTGGKQSTTSGAYWQDGSGFYLEEGDGGSRLHHAPTEQPPKSAHLAFNDGPYYATWDLAFPINQCSIVDCFKDYLMFRPDNGSDNIYVTLEIVVWSWSASSGKGSDGVWTGPAFSIPPPSDPSESEEFPVWENTYLP